MKNKFGDNALSIAAKKGNIEIIKVLINNGFHLGIGLNILSFVQEINKKDVDNFLRTNCKYLGEGCEAASIAREKKFPDIFDLLIETGKNMYNISSENINMDLVNIEICDNFLKTIAGKNINYIIEN